MMRVSGVYFDCEGPNQLCVIRGVQGSKPGYSFCSPAKCVTLLEEEYCVVITSFGRSEMHS